MNHFPVNDWIDFVRGVLPLDKEEQMQVHLDLDCSECVRSLQTWRTFLQFASQESRYQPPTDTVRVVKAAFVPEKPWKLLAELAQFARLVFDSSLQPARSAVRASMGSSRQLLLEADPFTIDLRMESDPVRRRVSVVGQILNSQGPKDGTSGADVVLLGGDRMLKRTLTNALGEFDLDFDGEPNLQLFISIRGQRGIGVSLPDLPSYDPAP